MLYAFFLWVNHISVHLCFWSDLLLIVAETDLGIPQQCTTQPGFWLSRTHAAVHTSVGRTQVLLHTTNHDHDCSCMTLTWRILLYPFPRLLSLPHNPWKTSMGLVIPFYCPIYKIYNNKVILYRGYGPDLLPMQQAIRSWKEKELQTST